MLVLILKSSVDEASDTFLVVSFIGETRIFAMNRVDELEETEIKGFLSEVRTLFCHDAVHNQLVQVFDSWAGSLSPADFRNYSQPYLFRIAEALKNDAPVILFPKGSWYALKDLSNSSAAGIGIDWCVDPTIARELTGNKITLQGNFDPAKLLAPVSEIKRAVKEMIDSFGAQRYIANLGHGITPNVPVDHARAFVDAVKEYR